MPRFAILAVLGLLTACVTPQEQCIAQATRDLRVLNGLIEVTGGNIRRGYAIETREYSTIEREFCGVNSDTGKRMYCLVPVTNTQEIPVSIDINLEKAKLASQLQRRAEMTADVKRAAAACAARYPKDAQ